MIDAPAAAEYIPEFSQHGVPVHVLPRTDSGIPAALFLRFQINRHGFALQIARASVRPFRNAQMRQYAADIVLLGIDLFPRPATQTAALHQQGRHAPQGRGIVGPACGG